MYLIKPAAGLDSIVLSGPGRHVFNPDVIFMDIGLPVLNGYDAAQRIRAQHADKKPVLVALTGWGQDADRRRSEDAGGDAHLVKPVDDRVLGKLWAELTGSAARSEQSDEKETGAALEGLVPLSGASTGN